jgi:hypothetical protein
MTIFPLVPEAKASREPTQTCLTLQTVWKGQQYTPVRDTRRYDVHV